MSEKVSVRQLSIVEGVESVWHYHLSETGKTYEPALCGRKQVMHTEIPMSCWGNRSAHIPDSFCKKCDELARSG